MATPEGEVLKAVLKFCSTVPGLRLSRNSSGRMNAHGRNYSYGCFVPGGPDLLGWYDVAQRPLPRHMLGVSYLPGPPTAIFVAIEVKAPGGGDEVHYTKTLLAQREFLKEAVAAGCIAGVVHSVEECAKLLGVEVR